MSVHFPKTHRRYMHYRKKDGLVVIKYGAEWCGPCKAIKPLMDKLAEKYATVYFLDVDVDTEKDPEEDLVMVEHDDFNNIRTIPHFKFFVNQELIREFQGADRERLKRYVERYSVNKSDKSNGSNKSDKDEVDKTDELNTEEVELNKDEVDKTVELNKVEVDKSDELNKEERLGMTQAEYEEEYNQMYADHYSEIPEKFKYVVRSLNLKQEDLLTLWKGMKEYWNENKK